MVAMVAILIPLGWPTGSPAAALGATVPVAPIAFRAAATGANATARTVDVPLPSGVQSGDLLLASIAVRGKPTVTAPAGWQLVRADENGTSMKQATFSRLASAGEPAAYTFGLSSSQAAAGVIVAYSGVDGTDPVETSTGRITDVNSRLISATSAALVTPGAVVIGLYGTATFAAITSPPSLVERAEVGTPATVYRVTSHAAELALPGVGATGDLLATASAGAKNIGQLVVLRPAGDGGPAPTPGPTLPPTPTPTSAPPTGEDPVLVGAGDIAGCSTPGDDATALLLDEIPGVVYTTGDNAYPNGTDAEYADCYDPTWGRHKSRTRPVPGNHEYASPGAAPYFRYFGSAAGEAGKGWYAYDLGTWRVIALNSNCGAVGGCHAGSQQEQWLRAELAANQDRNVLAYWHHPRFACGNHGNNAALTPFWQALWEYGADVVLAGHEHSYQRFSPQDPSGQADPAYGIRQIIVGTGGRSHYVPCFLPTTEAVNGDSYGVLKLTLGATSYSWEFVPVAGASFTDSGTSPTHGRPPAAAVQTVGLRASGVAGAAALSAAVESDATDAFICRVPALT
jgi:hypothetical protein